MNMCTPLRIFLLLVLLVPACWAQTTRVKDIHPGGNASNPGSLVNVNGVLFFAADDGVNGAELWKSDGTDAGTVLGKDNNPSGCLLNTPDAVGELSPA